MDLLSEVKQYLDAGAAGIWITSYEEGRVDEALRVLYDPHKTGKTHYRWSASRGLVDAISGQELSPPKYGLVGAMQAVLDRPALTLLFDPHHHLNGEDNSKHIRALREVLHAKAGPIIVIAPSNKIEVELTKLFTRIDFGLPTESELAEKVVKTEFPPADRARVAEALTGFTLYEAEIQMRVLLSRLGRKGANVASELWQNKAKALKVPGIDDISQPTVTLDDVGGLYRLKEWLNRRIPVFDKAARDKGVPVPRGIILTGPPGTGKTLIAKAVANAIGWKFGKASISNTQEGLVGSSEANMRAMLATFDALRPVVVFFDEIAHQVSGHESSGITDPGVMRHIIGMLMEWLEDRKDGVFVIGATNEPWRLPMHMIRSGRFDGSPWYVDYPAQDALDEILDIHMRQLDLDVVLPREKRKDLRAYMQENRFSGADVEEALREAVQQSFPKKPDAKEIDAAIRELVPSSATMREQIAELEKWAVSKTRKAA